MPFVVLGVPLAATDVGRYFSIAVQNKTTDLLITLDAQSGDPDM